MSGLSRRRMVASGALAALFSTGASRVAYGQSGRGLEIDTGAPGAPSANAASLPWYNWSGHLSCKPAGRIDPANEAELIAALKYTSGPVRPVGSGHSFAPLVPTDGHIIVIDQLAGLLAHDSAALSATFGAGTRLGDMGVPLQAIGQAMLVLPDIDRQTLAGALATATHGAGMAFSNLAGYVSDLRLVTAAGEVLNLSAEADADLFNAARVSLGALGIITRATLTNRPSYRLKARNWVAKTNEVLENFDELAKSHRHFEMFPLVHSDYALVLAIDETTEPIDNPPATVEEAAAFGAAMAAWAELPPNQRRPMINALAQSIEPSEFIDTSFKVLPNVRNNRFNEMEYSVPRAAGAACVREVLATIEQQAIDVVFPLEYRYVKGDDTWLSMSAGEEIHAAISIHRSAGADYRPYFDAIEPIFRKYGGRPHWGKVHSLGHAELTKLYPRFEDFRRLRQRLDPHGRLLNDHLRYLFGEST